MKYLVSVSLLVTVLYLKSTAQPTGLPEGFVAEQVCSGIDCVNMAFDPDDNIFVVAKSGGVYLVKDGVFYPEPIISLPVDTNGERGLLGIAIDPDFESNHYVYVYYTVSGLSRNRISRFMFHEDDGEVGQEEIILTLDHLEADVHNGGAIKFGADGKLYIATGDGYNNVNAQSQQSLLGKILRLNPDGTIPTDNPFYLQNTGVYKSIYAYGFRNPFSFSFDKNNRLFVNDVGSGSYEEINEVYAGKNYGWPIVEGKLSNNPNATEPENYQDPLYAYSHDKGCAIVGSTFYNSTIPAFPENYNGKYFFTDFCNWNINLFDLNTNEVSTFITSSLAPVFLSVSDKGEFYFMTFNYVVSGAVWRVKYAPGGSPAINIQPQSQVKTVGESVRFEIGASGESPLIFQWMIDGVDINGATDKVLVISGLSLTDNNHTYSCRVENEVGANVSQPALLIVTDRNRPQITFETPYQHLLYKAGDTVFIKAIVTDEIQGLLPDSVLNWQVNFQHNIHAHPVLTARGTDSIGFVVPKIGETSSNVWFRAYLTAINNIGLSNSSFMEIFPKVVNVTIESGKSTGVGVSLDGTVQPTPFSFSSVAGMTRTLNAPYKHYEYDSVFTFYRWEKDIITPDIVFDVPDYDTTMIATYSALSSTPGLTAELYNQNQTFNPPANYIDLNSIVDFDSDQVNPQLPYINGEYFTIRWNGYLNVPAKKNYTFYLQSRGGSRLWLNNNLVIDNWNSTNEEKSFSISLDSSKFYKIRVDYYDSFPKASIKLSWSATSIPKSTVPKSQFSTNNPDNTPPQVDFNFSSDYFTANNQFIIKGIASDLEDNLSPKDIHWKVDLYQDGGLKPMVKDSTGLDSLVLKTNSIYGDATVNTWYQAEAIIKDLDGSSSVVRKNIYPLLSRIEVKMNIDKVLFTWNDESFDTYASFQKIQGTEQTIVIPEFVTLNDTTYKFGKWLEISSSDTILLFQVPASDRVLTSIYTKYLNVTTGTSEFEEKAVIFPNPFTTSFNIKRQNNHSARVTYQICNQIGQLIQEIESSDELTDPITLKEQGAGIYYLFIKGEKSVRPFKLVKL
jgi:glucose/arabinose dehydrogenase